MRAKRRAFGGPNILRISVVRSDESGRRLNMDMIGPTQGPGYSDPDRAASWSIPANLCGRPGDQQRGSRQRPSRRSITATRKPSLNHFYDATAPDATHDNLGPQPHGRRISIAATITTSRRWGFRLPFSPVGCIPTTTGLRTRRTRSITQQMSSRVKNRRRCGVGAEQAGRPPATERKLPDELMKDMKAAKDQGWGRISSCAGAVAHEPF